MNYPCTQWATGPCWYCGVQTYRTGLPLLKPWSYTRDHLIPRRRRKPSLRHIEPQQAYLLTVTCCFSCNQKKADMPIFKFAKLSNLPKEKLAQIHKVHALNRGVNNAHV